MPLQHLCSVGPASVNGGVLKGETAGWPFDRENSPAALIRRDAPRGGPPPLCSRTVGNKTGRVALLRKRSGRPEPPAFTHRPPINGGKTPSLAKRETATCFPPTTPSHNPPSLRCLLALSVKGMPPAVGGGWRGGVGACEGWRREFHSKHSPSISRRRRRHLSTSRPLRPPKLPPSHHPIGGEGVVSAAWGEGGRSNQWLEGP